MQVKKLQSYDIEFWRAFLMDQARKKVRQNKKKCKNKRFTKWSFF
jgi:hypothetical protein